MIILVYILILLIIIYLSFHISNRDYFNVTFLTLLGYTISAICCLYNYNLWGVSLHLYTIAIIFAGLLSISIGDRFGQKLKVPNHTNVKERDIFKLLNYGNSKVKLIISIVFSLIITILLFKDIVRIASLDMKSWGSIIYNFRQNLDSADSTTNYSIAVNLGLRITRPLAYIYLFIFLGKTYSKDKQEKLQIRILYLIPVLLYGYQVLLRGVRITIISLIIGCVFLIYFFIQTTNNWKYRVSLKLLVKIFAGILIVCITFYYAKFFIGKMQESNGVILYVTNYLGGSLQLFDMYLTDGKGSGSAETFSALINSFQNQFGAFSKISTLVQREHRRAFNGVYIGNVYTGFRNYYNDFGLFGVIILSSLLGFIFSYWYKKLVTCKRWTVNKLFSLLFYASMLYGVIFHFFTDFFYSLIGIGWCVNAILFYLTCVVIFKVRIRIK